MKEIAVGPLIADRKCFSEQLEAVMHWTFQIALEQPQSKRSQRSGSNNDYTEALL